MFDTILKSASKIVFVLMTLALIGLTAFGKVDPGDFVMLTAMAFTYYFSKSGQSSSKPKV